jgi:hypothetical protein
MKFNKWTLGLAAVGVVSLASAARADEKMSQIQTALSNTTISGYVDVAATWRPGTDLNANGGPNIPVYSYAQNDGFSLNAVDIALDKPLDESPWASGYHVEMMFGQQNPVGIPGFANGLGSLRQAYIALRTPVGNSGIDWKVGVFDTIIGYESNSDPLNPNYTRSYGYTIEPTTHTGVLATFKANDMISFSAGVANTWSEGPILTATGTTYESQKTYMGAIALTAPDSAGFMKGATLNAGIINACDSTKNGAGSKTSWYAGVTVPTPITALKVGASYDYLDNHSGGGEAWVGALYGSFQANDKLSFNLRGEYLQDDAGILYSFNSPGVRRNTAEEVTATVQYQLWANVLSRVEFRWDHVEHGNSFGANAAGNAFRDNDFLLALNLIYQF